MPRKIARPQAILSAELSDRLAAMEARNALPRPLRVGAFDLDRYVDDLVTGRDRPGVVRVDEDADSTETIRPAVEA